MTPTKTILAAVYDNYTTAQEAQPNLLQGGFTKDEIRISSNETQLKDDGSEPEHEGGISGFFSKLFGSHPDSGTEYSSHYAESVKRGGSVVTATVDEDRVAAASQILESYDPVDFEEKLESYRQEGYTGYPGIPTTPAATATVSTGDKTIPVVQEELKVGKRTVQSGGVRVYSRVTETPVNESVTLREEHVRVERRPVDRAATEADFRSGDQVIEVVETAEEAVVGKTARVVEEVVVGKESSLRTETVKDTVRRTDVDVKKTTDKE